MLAHKLRHRDAQFHATELPHVPLVLQRVEFQETFIVEDVQDVMRAGFFEEELSRRSSRASCESNESLGRRDIKGERRAAEAKLRRACEDLRLELDDVEGA